MGKSTQPLLKRCKALGINPVVMGYTKESKRNQKEVRRAKKSEYGLQLMEKQKLRFIYGVLGESDRLQRLRDRHRADDHRHCEHQAQ